MLYSILYICTITIEPMNRVSAPIAPPSQTTAYLPNYRHEIDRLLVLLQCRSIMASKCISKLARSQPPSVSLTGTITPSKCISKLARLRSPNTLDHGIQVNLPTRSITASQCISKLARLWSPSESPNSLDYGLGVHL